MRSIAVRSGREALERLRSGERFDLAILDMQMPEMDGLTLAREIRRTHDPSSLPLVMLTSLGRREPGTESVAFAAFLTKPIKHSQLFDAVATALARENVPRREAPSAGKAEKLGARLPLRILVAEDSMVNQRVALLLLDRLGYRADVAGNGREALEALERQPYDLVFMDVQMPEMDGLEATRRIRERWPEADRPRIVAMTANAMVGDREACLAAGMDDYLSKPIHIEELRKAVRRCRPRQRESVPAEVFDLAVLERLRDTFGEGGSDVIAELIATFLEESPRLLATAATSLSAGQAEELCRAAHSLKGGAASLGATALAAQARALEAAARNGDLDRAAALMPQVEAAYEEARPPLQEWSNVGTM
jgi:CheY-like chemotaxis protein